MSILYFGILLIQFSCYCACKFSSFTWVSNEENEYFWQSPSFRWNATTTLGVFGDITSSDARIEMRDYAQSLGIKVVKGTSPSDIDMTDATEREKWINYTIAYTINEGLDGINMDYEGHDPSLTDSYNQIVVDFCNAMHEAIPGSEVSVDVPIYPQFEGRNYDYKRMAEACDTLFVMAYDGEFWDNVQCRRSSVNCSLACASIDVVEYGIQQYLELGVPASSIMLGLPWYGLRYEYIAHIPFFTGQLKYQDILNIMDKAGDKGSSKFDEQSSTWIFDCGGLCSQWSDDIDDRTSEIWYDDPNSLSPKYALASQYKLKGVGMWEATHVDYNVNAATPEADAMWNSLCQEL